MGKDYVLLTALYNEKDNIEKLVDSILSQTLKPAKWIIIDDGSTDGSTKLLNEKVSHLDFVHTVSREINNSYNWEAIAKVYREAENQLKKHNMACDYIAILDGDTFVEQNCFEELMATLESEESVASVSSEIYVKKETKWIVEKGDDNPRGAVRMFEKNAWMEIGGIPLAPSYEFLMDVKLLNRGYRSIKNRNVSGFQSRRTGERIQGNPLYTKGRVYHKLGFTLPYTLISSAYRSVTVKPYFISGILFLSGYISGALSEKSLNDADVQKFSRNVLSRTFGESV